MRERAGKGAAFRSRGPCFPTFRTCISSCWKKDAPGTHIIKKDEMRGEEKIPPTPKGDSMPIKKWDRNKERNNKRTSIINHNVQPPVRVHGKLDCGFHTLLIRDIDLEENRSLLAALIRRRPVRIDELNGRGGEVLGGAFGLQGGLDDGSESGRFFQVRRHNVGSSSRVSLGDAPS